NGEWRLSPAFDVAYSYNPSGDWTSQHQMSLSGKRDGFSADDLIEFARIGDVKKTRVKAMLAEVSQAVADWRTFASEAAVPKGDIDRVAKAHRRELFA
ncbi:MAG: type II toxin-antitoxin system HipA family toxin, partial [Congregibacter sp.]|nr:type II toxin-antitoxin system HipA family toxin [Congregibacter sp.]